MGKKLTIKEIKYYIEIESNSGCKLLSTEYKGSKEKLDIQCKCGEIFQISLEKFKYQNKRQCNKCSGIIKWNINSVREYIEGNSDCKLLSNEYINYDTKLKLLCSCGEEFYISFDKFKQGKHACNNCSNKLSHDKQRFTYKEIKEYIENNSECKVLSKEYKGAHDDLKLQCNCGDTFYRSLNNFKSSKHNLCPKCTQEIITNYHRLDYKEVKNYIESFGCKLISETYVNNQMPLEIQCECGELFKRSLDVFKRNDSCHCEKCSNIISSNKRRYGYEYIYNFIKETGCELLTEYKENITLDEKLKIKCHCGNIFYTRFADFKRKKIKQCNVCSGILEIDINYVKNFVENNSNCELLSDIYNNMNDKLDFKCECGEIFATTFSAFKLANQRQCKKCGYLITASKMKLSYEEVKRRIEIKGNELLSTEYKNNNTKLKLKCKCGEIFYRKLDNYMNGSDCCDYCNKSKGEKECYKVLEKYNITFKQQETFEGCKGNRKLLPFDFSVYINNKLKFLIEYQGEQHYRYVPQFHRNEKGFEKQLDYDNRKRIYCKNNNIELLEIPYWDFNNIEDILLEKLNIIEELKEVISI